MRLLNALVLLFAIAPAAWASQNLNHLSCIYFHNNSGWIPYGWQSSGAKFNLMNGEAKFLIGAWTSDRPKPNYAICSTMTGTNDDNMVNITSTKYRATVVNTIGDGCAIDGADVELVSEDVSLLSRGSYVELESDWLILPSPDKIMIRTYLPRNEEIDQIEAIAEKKCLELIP